MRRARSWPQRWRSARSPATVRRRPSSTDEAHPPVRPGAPRAALMTSAPGSRVWSGGAGRVLECDYWTAQQSAVCSDDAGAAIAADVSGEVLAHPLGRGPGDLSSLGCCEKFAADPGLALR